MTLKFGNPDKRHMNKAESHQENETYIFLNFEIKADYSIRFRRLKLVVINK